MGKEKFIPVIALVVLLIGCGSSIYVYATQIDSEFISINNIEYTIDQIFFVGRQTTIESSDEQFTGIALDDLMLKSGVTNPESREYIITAADGYQKTVQWGNMENGILTEDAMSVFSDLPKSFRVRDIVNIEVI